MVILNYLGEIWKDIPEFEGLYQGSNFGRIRSLDRVVLYSNGRKYKYESKILKPLKNKNGYLMVSLSKNGKVKKCKVHRLVWSAFHGAIPEGMQINHINEIKTDNRLENLELVTPKENSNYGTRTERMAKALSKSVFQYSLEGELIKEWCSINEVARQTHFSQGHISSCCSGKLKSAYGYIWKYKN